jgi:2-polyprenyl-3-methyl-5-hydroxy-6-metoxy-1,4-benzoquinol methylase
MPIQERYLATNFSQRNKPLSSYPSRLAVFLLGHAQLREGRLLDLGSGRGDLAKAFRDCGLTVEIADANPEASELAGSSFEFHLVHRDGSIAAQSNYFDCVLLKSVIEHLHDPFPLLAEIRRVLRPGGKLIVLTPSWRHNLEVFYDAPGHVQPYTLRSLDLTLKIAGFTPNLSEEMRQVPWTWTRFGKKVSRVLSPVFRLVPRSIRRADVRFLREVTLLAVVTRS